MPAPVHSALKPTLELTRPLTAAEHSQILAAYRSASQLIYTTTLPLHFLSRQIPLDELWAALLSYHDHGTSAVLESLCTSLVWGPRGTKPFGDCVDFAVLLHSTLPELLEIIGSPYHACVVTKANIEFQYLDVFFLSTPVTLGTPMVTNRPGRPSVTFWRDSEEQVWYKNSRGAEVMGQFPPLDDISATVVAREKHFLVFPGDEVVRIDVPRGVVVFTNEGTSKASVVKRWEIRRRRDVEDVLAMLRSWLERYNAEELEISVKFLLAMMLQGSEREALRNELIG